MIDKIVLTQQTATIVYDDHVIQLSSDKDIVELVQYFLDWKTPLRFAEHRLAVATSMEDTCPTLLKSA